MSDNYPLLQDHLKQSSGLAPSEAALYEATSCEAASSETAEKINLKSRSVGKFPPAVYQLI